jgi:hypothetical protein
MTEGARIKARAEQDAAAAAMAQARVRELELRAATAPSPGAATCLDALTLARDPAQQIQTDKRCQRARLLELAEMGE